MKKRYHLYMGKKYEVITPDLYKESFISLEEAQSAFLASEYENAAVVVADSVPILYEKIDELIHLHRDTLEGSK